MSQVKGLRLGRLEDAADPLVELRTAIVRVRFTPVEKGRLHEITREMGLSLAEYMRRVVLDRPLPSRRAIRPIPVVNQDLYVELRRIGVNLNQLAQRMNRAESPDRREILPVLEMLAGAVADITMKVIGAAGREELRRGSRRDREDHARRRIPWNRRIRPGARARARDRRRQHGRAEYS